MSSLSALEQLLQNDAALEQARRSASYAQNTQEILSRPLSDFSSGSIRDPAGVPSLERLQASIATKQYMESGTIRHVPAPTAPTPTAPINASVSSGGSAVKTAVPTTATAPPAPPRTVAGPLRVQLPTTTQLATTARSVLPRLGVTALHEVGVYLQGQIDSANEQIGNQLPNDLQPIWDRVAGPNGLIEGVTSPPNLAGYREFARFSGDANRIWRGLPPRSLSGAIAQQLSCLVFGSGCPTSTEGIPNLGSSTPAPPFYGGQLSGVAYRVEFKVETVSNTGTPNTSQSAYNNVSGPIRGIRTAPITDIEGNQRTAVRIFYGNPETYIEYGSYLTSFFQSVKPSITNVIRMDGQPDTGGNPAPLPDAPYQPATAPALSNRTLAPPSNPPSLPSTAVPNPSITPVTSPSTAPPNTKAEDPLAPLRNSDPLNNLIPLLGALPFLIPSFGKSFNPSGAKQLSSGSGGAVPTITDIPTPTCRYDSAGISGKVDQANLTLQAVQLIMEQQVISKLNTIDTKLGPQIPNGGVSGFLGKMFDFAKKTWDFLQIDRVLSILTWIGVLHNAYQLSNALSQTLFSAISNVLNFVGIEDSEGNSLDVGSIVSEFTDNFFKSIFGVETVDGIKAAWKKFNRIYQAAANIVWSLQSITFSMVEILETISNYVGRIGNALRRSGEVLENSFNWMNPNANYSSNRFFNALNNVSQAVEAVDQVASEALSIQETGAELANQKQEFDTATAEAEALIATQESTSKTDSIKPSLTISPIDEARAGD